MFIVCRLRYAWSKMQKKEGQFLKIIHEEHTFCGQSTLNQPRVTPQHRRGFDKHLWSVPDGIRKKKK